MLLNYNVLKCGKKEVMKYCFIINPKAGKGAFVAGLEQNIKDQLFYFFIWN